MQDRAMPINSCEGLTTKHGNGKTMAKILLTGMSGTGTSTVLKRLARRGWDVVDTDYGGWKVPGPDGDLIWDEARMDQLLSNAPDNHHMAVDGCVSNQGGFYDRFDAVVHLTAPLDVMLERVVRRTTNDYGKTEVEREEIRSNTALVVPLLRASADLEIDTSRTTVDDIVEQLIAMASRL
jgi:shikimate kinase